MPDSSPVWWMHTRLDTSAFPGKRQIVHLRFTDDVRKFWIVVEDGEPSVCLSEPGFDVDVSIISDLSSLHQVWLGRITATEALRAGRLRFDGPSSLTRLMPGALQLSPVAPLVRAAEQLRR